MRGFLKELMVNISIVALVLWYWVGTIDLPRDNYNLSIFLFLMGFLMSVYHIVLKFFILPNSQTVHFVLLAIVMFIGLYIGVSFLSEVQIASTFLTLQDSFFWEKSTIDLREGGIMLLCSFSISMIKLVYNNL